MSNLSTDIDNLKKKYREIFLKTGEEFQLRVEKMTQEEFLKFLYEDVLKEMYQKQLSILNLKQKFNCSGCAACCKLACSEFSPSELKQKAKNGDNFAAQFTSVFIPYENEEEAKKIYPEYFELLKIKAKNEHLQEKVYFYHCPKVTKENRCPDYENRPQICKDFPDNPISFLPETCGFAKWKVQTENEALILHSMMEIVEFYKQKLKTNSKT